MSICLFTKMRACGCSEKKIFVFSQKKEEKCLQFPNSSYLCNRKTERDSLLGYGVMVTLQILVLSFLVRIQVAQHQKEGARRKMCSLFWRCMPAGAARIGFGGASLRVTLCPLWRRLAHGWHRGDRGTWIDCW